LKVDDPRRSVCGRREEKCHDPGSHGCILDASFSQTPVSK
jgi:hypothetical protein